MEAIEKDTGVKGGCEVLQLDAGDAQSVQRLVDVVKVKFDGKLEGLVGSWGRMLRILTVLIANGLLNQKHTKQAGIALPMDVRRTS